MEGLHWQNFFVSAVWSSNAPPGTCKKKKKTVPPSGFHFQKLYFFSLQSLVLALKTANMFQPQFVLMLCVSVKIFVLRSERGENVRLAVLPAWFGSSVCVNRSELLILKASVVSAVFTPQHTSRHVTSHLHTVFSWLHTHSVTRPLVHILQVVPLKNVRGL